MTESEHQPGEYSFRQALNTFEVPDHLHEGLVLYVFHHCPTGGCLAAVIGGDLFEAFGRADDNTAKGMYDIVRFIVNKFPPGSWGSNQSYIAWIRQHD